MASVSVPIAAHAGTVDLQGFSPYGWWTSNRGYPNMDIGGLAKNGHGDDGFGSSFEGKSRAIVDSVTDN